MNCGNLPGVKPGVLASDVKDCWLNPLMHTAHLTGNTSKSSSDWLNPTGFPENHLIAVVFLSECGYVDVAKKQNMIGQKVQKRQRFPDLEYECLGS